MPVYSYRCSACGTEFDAARAVDERDVAAECPQCANTSFVDRVFVLPREIMIPRWLRHHTCWDDVAPFATPSRKMDRKEFLAWKKKKEKESPVPIEFY